MGFSIKGFPSSVISEDNIILNLKVHFSIWLNELNFENYTSSVFKLDLKLYNKGISDSNFSYKNMMLNEQINTNNLIAWELRTLKSLNNWIEKIFSFYNFDIFDIDSFKNKIERDDIRFYNSEKTDFINHIKNNNSIGELKKSAIISEKIESAKNEDILYFLILMYLDFTKIEYFLKEKYSYNLPETKNTNANIPQSKKETIAKKVPEKWFALLYWIELKIKNTDAPRDSEGAFAKNKIEEIGKLRTGTTGQSFYRSFREIEKNHINKMYGSDWKERIIELSGTDKTIIKYLKKNF